MNPPGPSIRQRLAAGFAVAILHLAAICGLIAAFAGGLVLPKPGDAMLSSLFAREPPRDPRPPPPPQRARREPGGAPKPAGKRSQAAPALASAIAQKISPMPSAAIPQSGNQATSGAAEAGSGTGAGGSGQGSGSGDGDGDGQGGGTDLRLISGAIDDDDYPREAVRLHQSGDVHIRFTVGANGRVGDCTVTRSSGSPSLDSTTCRLILRRFRYEPSRDGAGRPYADTVTGVHEWRMGGRIEDDAEGEDR